MRLIARYESSFSGIGFGAGEAAPSGPTGAEAWPLDGTPGYGAFPSMSINPPQRVPQRVKALLAMEKALEAVALAPTMNRDAAVSAMKGFYSLATPLLRQAFYAYRADYVFALWGAGDPEVTKDLAETSGRLVSNWLLRADKILEMAPPGWVVYLASVEQGAADLLRGALEFHEAAAQVVADAVKKMGQSFFDVVPWWVWALGVGAVAVYLDVPRKLGLLEGRTT